MDIKDRPNRVEVIADGKLIHDCDDAQEALAVARQWKRQSRKVTVFRYENNEIWDSYGVK